ncbi:carboxypeptidase-like regulatory domain-containing protein [Mucilaginibacter sp.]|uniref:carboxypeptidase-like regulatory domain-containing protein n=1 Tax=Mucilaginibacter sp. TaxID=1882438 RepID=UPI003263493A
MKKLALFFALLLIVKVSSAQTIAVQGTVVDASGKPVPLAFVRDALHAYATYTDADGSYTLKADPASKLIATAKGFGTGSAPVKEGGVNITLAAGDGAATSTAAGSLFSVHSDASVTTVLGSFASTTEVQGSRYLSESWMHGYAIGADGSVVQDPALLFNYDMMGGDVIYTADQKAINTVDRASVKTISLFDDKGVGSTLAYVPAVDNTHYVKVLANGPKYKMYKQIIIRYMKATYQTNGMTSTGNKYDEYAPTYLYFFAKGNDAPMKFNPKKKTLKELFAADADKLDKYMSSAKGDIDDAYLTALGDAMNQ